MTNRKVTYDVAVGAAEAVYRKLLGEKVSPRRLRWIRRCALRGEGVDSVVTAIIRSERVRRSLSERATQFDRAIYEFRRLARDPEILSALFDRSAQFQRAQASDLRTLYPGGIIEPDADGPSLDGRLRYFDGGKPFMRQCFEWLRERGVEDLSLMTCLDFGCGAGQLSFIAAQRFFRVISVDVSQAALDETERNLRDFVTEIYAVYETVLLSNFKDAGALPEADLVVSQLALERYPPPLMGIFVRGMLKALRPGGYALLHIPLHIPDYRFDLQEYLDDPQSGNRRETHVLPRSNLKFIAQRYNAEIVDSVGFGPQNCYRELFLLRRAG